MSLVLTLLCRNEEDIINETIRFHLKQGVDYIIATDNGSTDNTLNILRSYEQQGVLRLLQEPKHNHDQATWVTRMARMASREYGANWVINSDADEFWLPTTGTIKSTLQAIPNNIEALTIDRYNFLPPESTTNPCEPFYAHQIIREKISLNSLGRKLPPKICHRGNDSIDIGDGNHSASINRLPVKVSACDTLEVLHFPYRSYQQLERKIREGTEALERNTRIGNGIGITWRYLYHEHLLKGTLQQYYQQLRPDPQLTARQLEEGSLVVDIRLQKFLGEV